MFDSVFGINPTFFQIKCDGNSMRSQFAEEDLDRSLVDQNIKRLQKLLRGCTNDDEREVLLGLLAEEEAKLKELSTTP
jgi:hypothetical protein